MSSTTSIPPSVNAMVVDEQAMSHKPGKFTGDPRPPRQHEQDSDALSAFTCFFHAKVQVKELAICKEAHAFDQLVWAERAHHATPYHACGCNLTLDHCAPAPIVPVPDPGPDVSEIVAAAEQLDLKQVGHMPHITSEDMFGRLISIGLLVSNVLILAVLLAVFASVTRS
ncbi:hypothetical protein DFJ58DRAFT_733309 [Suillus subalutaceus]|uniref:uncharacterized protein n=1 Tax=Suillus subalutaceus TaxID=48586 RepID=UPI001B88419B|nr:uncharacterized protein DFJ58DRAFT_733309 [Suillus subalutaceus]KAG1839442.1 hypothetical protein DFJ58DRAFT_733309 [Suillus subalutaceus]